MLGFNALLSCIFLAGVVLAVPVKRYVDKAKIESYENSVSYFTIGRGGRTTTEINVQGITRFQLCMTDAQPSVYGLKGITLVDGKLYFLCGQSDKIQFYDGNTTGPLEIDLPTKTGSYLTGSASTNSLYVLQSTFDYRPTSDILVIDIDTGLTTTWTPVDEPIISMEAGPNGDVVIQTNDKIYVFNSDQDLIKTIPEPHQANLLKSVTQDSDGDVIFLAEKQEADENGQKISLYESSSLGQSTMGYAGIIRAIDLVQPTDLEPIEYNNMLIADPIAEKIYVAFLGTYLYGDIMIDYEGDSVFQAGLLTYDDGLLIVGDIGHGGYGDAYFLKSTQVVTL